MNKQTVYIACYGKDSDAQLILPLTNNKSALNGMPHPVKKIDSVYVLTEQELNEVKREVAKRAWDACDNHISEAQVYHYGRRGGYMHPNKIDYLDTNYPIK